MKVEIEIPDRLYYLLKYAGIEPTEFFKIFIECLEYVLEKAVKEALKEKEQIESWIREAVNSHLRSVLGSKKEE